jgi:5-hydroxyisourate hydrolase
MAHLSTHVLDTAGGTPAAGIVIELHAWRDGARQPVTTLTTGSDGRAGGPQLEAGVYELTFHAGDYFRAAGLNLPDPPFLDEIVIRFGIAETSGRYHVPLLLAPYSYSTYRGS